MKKNFNVIQINGFKGILCVIFIGCCLVAGFGWFPGWSCMKLWNLLSSYYTQIPSINTTQGMLLWGIIAASYFTFRKDKLVVCMRTSDGLSDEEIKEVFSEMKRQARDDKFLQSMLKAHNSELKIKNLSESNVPQKEAKEEKEKIEIK